MTKLETTAQPFCDCMLGLKAVRDAASDYCFRLSLRSIALVPFAFKEVLLQRSNLLIGRVRRRGVYPEGVPTKG